MKKNIVLGILLAVCMLINGTTVPAQSRASEEYDISVQVITGLNIMSCDENGDFRGGDNMTREDFVIAALRMMGIGEMPPSDGEPVYKDVPSARWSYPYILKATEVGITDGDDTQNFYPERNITANEANRMIVALLGYEMIAQSKGGYPSGYNEIAVQKGFGNTHSERPLTRNEIAQMLYKALDVEMMEYEYNGNGGISSSDKTLLGEYLKVDKGRGIISANSVTGIYAKDSALSENKIEITDNGRTEIFNAGDTNAAGMLGYGVEYYYYTDSNDSRELLVAAPFKTNKTVVIKASELEAETDNSKIVYTPDKSSKIKRETIKKDVPVLRGGVFADFAGFAADDIFDILSGEIEIIYYKSEISLIKVKEYRDFYISASTDKNGIVRLYFGENKYAKGSIEIDAEEMECAVLLGGSAVGPDEIKAGDVISIMADDESFAEPKAIEIHLSRDRFEGVVTSIDDEYVTFGGVEYPIACGLNKTLKTGDEGTLYLNYNGEAAYFVAGVSTEWSYGYLTFFSENEITEGDNYCKFKILNAEGDFEMLDSGERVKIDGEKVNYLNIVNLLDSGRLIQYKKSADGKLSEIRTAVKKGDQSGYTGYDEDRFSCDSRTGVRYTYKSSAPVCFSYTDSLTGVFRSYLVTDDTVVFDVSNGNPDEYYVGKAVDFFEDGILYTVQIYDNNEYLQTPVVVYLGDVSSDEKVGWNNPAFVVDKVRQTLNVDNETEYVITGYEKGAEKTLTAAGADIIDEGGTNIALASLKRGSVIQYKTDLKGQVNYFRLLYSPAITTVSQKAWKGSDINSQLTTFFGNIYTRTDNSLTFTQDGAKTICAYSAEGVNVYLYDGRGSTVETASMKEIGVYKDMGGGADLVFMRMNRGNIADILIVR